MKILVACEESQTVTLAFREKGHEAYSFDLLPCSGGHSEWHIQADNDLHIKDILYKRKNQFDMLIGFPPCTRLCNSGVLRLYKDGKKINGVDLNKWQEMEQAALFFKMILNAPIQKKVLENPVPHGYALQRIGKRYTQCVQPYYFGDDASKRTCCLWIDGLDKLIIPPKKYWFPPRIVNGKPRWGNQTDSGQNKIPPSPDRAFIRSKTYFGIAKAMADQWG